MTLRKRTDYIVVHVTATPPDRDIGVKEVDAMHRARGWNGIGYHYVIRRDGRVEKGRPENQVGAHVAGFNSISLGVSLVGGVDGRGKPEDNRTPAQTHALTMLLRKLVEKYPGAKICGHRDLSPDRDRDGIVEPHEHLKACPCFDAIPWAKSQGLPAASILGAWDRNAAPAPAAPKGPDDRTVYLQKLLKRAGYEFGPVDGISGPKTEAALKRFQNAAGLPASGRFDPVTVDRLRAMFEAGRPDPVVVTEEVEKEVVPPAVEREVERKTGWWQKVTGVFGFGGVGGGMLFGLQWQTVAVIAGCAILTLILIVLLRRQIVAAVREIKAGLA